MPETLMRCGACHAEDEPDCIRCGLCIDCRPKFYAISVSCCSEELFDWLRQYLPATDGFWVYWSDEGGNYTAWPDACPDAMVHDQGEEVGLTVMGWIVGERRGKWPKPVDVGLVAEAVKAARDARE